jgi:hypothetical protein
LSILFFAGTGKTATVLASINQLRSEVAAGKLNEFSFIEINCLRLKSPHDACKCFITWSLTCVHDQEILHKHQWIPLVFIHFVYLKPLILICVQIRCCGGA